jgi:hypothetical protein
VLEKSMHVCITEGRACMSASQKENHACMHASQEEHACMHHRKNMHACITGRTCMLASQEEHACLHHRKIVHACISGKRPCMRHASRMCNGGDGTTSSGKRCNMQALRDHDLAVTSLICTPLSSVHCTQPNTCGSQPTCWPC